MTQRRLFPTIVKPETNPEMSIKERFDLFHEKNPEVFKRIAEIAITAKLNGMKRWSINGIFEVLRWQSSFETRGEQWKLNNSLRASYARKVMSDIPALAGFFETRKKKTD